MRLARIILPSVDPIEVMARLLNLVIDAGLANLLAEQLASLVVERPRVRAKQARNG
jgi:hypothetical protein